MTAFRRNPITGEPVIHAPERADRPRAFVDATDGARCPFCPGHEADTPPEILRVSSSPRAQRGVTGGTAPEEPIVAVPPMIPRVARDKLHDTWTIRVVPNKYPPVPGAEVIIESGEHDATFDGIGHAADVVRVYADRVRAHRDAAHVALFKNEGARAGSSIPHLHSQIVPLPFLPPRVERELAGFARAGACPLCGEVAEDLVIRETNAFRWIAPHVSSMAYQQWIVPKRHVATIAEFSEGETSELAALLRAATAATRTIADSFNWTFMTFPSKSTAHCYVELFPRVTTIAGLELGTGTFVEIVDPVAAARRLRS